MKKALLRTFIISVFVLAMGTFAYSQAETETPRQPDRPLKVTHNPPPGYTPQARIDGVSGWIKLRVTFLETGEIGDIFYVDESSPDKALTKTGLLKKAYESAKKIEFQPAIKEGKAVTVTKVLIYNFQLGRRP